MLAAQPPGRLTEHADQLKWKEMTEEKKINKLKHKHLPCHKRTTTNN